MKNRFLIAVSGGPDSMALLDQQRKLNNDIEVAHVNYHKRDTAKRDENIVKNYCKKYKIKFNKLDVYPQDVKGNFQAYARLRRYEFFAYICEKHHLECVLVAHHMDDNIETYLMQMDKKIGVNHYGIAGTSYLYGVQVVRPLLNETKQDLLQYCIDNKIPYGIDESNLTDSYQRNIVRHQRVDKMSLADKKKIVKQINKRNSENAKHFSMAVNYIQNKDEFVTKDFLKIPYLKEFLKKFFVGKSDKYIDEMIRQLKDAKSCVYFNNGIYLVKEYKKIHFFLMPNEYSYTFKKIDDLKSKNYEEFKLRKRGNSFEGVTLSKKDFPITIRNVRQGDSIAMRYGTKKLNRFFIDNKICMKDRLSWPILLNKNGTAILVPGLGCDLNHYSNKHNLFVIKY